MAALCFQAFRLIGAAQRAAPAPEGDHREQNGSHAVEQKQHRLVALGIEEHLLCLIPDFLLLHRTQGHQHDQVMEAVADHEPEIGQLSGQEQQALDELPVQHIAQAQH